MVEALENGADELLRPASPECLAVVESQALAPEARRRLQKFQPSQDLSLLSPHDPRHAAGQLLICLQIRQQKLLRTGDLSRNRHKASVRAHVNRFRMLLKRLVPQPPV